MATRLIAGATLAVLLLAPSVDGRRKGVIKDVSLAYLPEAEVGDYVIVHVGFAISRLDEEEAQETLALLAAVAAEAEGT